jgi:hypothetical protein
LTNNIADTLQPLGALVEVEVILDFQTGGHHHWDSYPSPAPIYLACYQVLESAHDPRASEFLYAACQWLDERTRSIQSPHLRRSFLKQVPSNQELARLCQANGFANGF